MKKTKVVFCAIFIFAILSCVLLLRLIVANEEVNEGVHMTKWFNWKVNNLDNEEQKVVVDYFKEIEDVFDKAKRTQYQTHETVLGYPDSKRALEIVEKSIDVFNKIEPPELCVSHYELTRKILYFIRDYQAQRLKLKENEIFEYKLQKDKIFESKIRNAKIKQLDFEEKRQKEYYNILRKIEFYDNALDEMVTLEIITKEEKEQLE